MTRQMWRVRRAAVAAFLGGMWLFQGLLVPSVTHAADAAAPANAYATRVLELTNAERQKAGLAPLTLSAPLTRSAAGYADVLASNGCFAHSCGPVPEMVQRDELAGYTDWSAVAENIAAGYASPEAVVTGWMNSPGHRANILNGAYAEIGIGFATGGAYGSYWTQEFGARRAAAPPAVAGVQVPAFEALSLAEEAAAPADALSPTVETLASADLEDEA